MESGTRNSRLNRPLRFSSARHSQGLAADHTGHRPNGILSPRCGLGSGLETGRYRWRRNRRFRCARYILIDRRRDFRGISVLPPWCFLIEPTRTVLFPKLVDVIEQPANKFFIPNIAVIFDDGLRRASDQKRA